LGLQLDLNCYVRNYLHNEDKENRSKEDFSDEGFIDGCEGGKGFS